MSENSSCAAFKNAFYLHRLKAPDGLPWQRIVQGDISDFKPTAEWAVYFSRYCSHRVFKTQRTLSARESLLLIFYIGSAITKSNH